MRGILSSIIILSTACCVVFTLWRHRARNLAYVKATVEGCWDGSSEKRKFRRFKVELPVNCTIPEKADSVYKAFTKDISGRGLCLKTSEIVPKENIINLLVDMPGSKRIKISGEVVWVKEIAGDNTCGRQFNAGIRFVKIDPRDRRILDNFILDTAR